MVQVAPVGWSGSPKPDGALNLCRPAPSGRPEGRCFVKSGFFAITSATIVPGSGDATANRSSPSRWPRSADREG
jgi:hypothetical protein